MERANIPRKNTIANFRSTDDPMTAPATPQDIQIHFEKGIPVKLTTEGKEITDSLELFIALNAIGKLHGIGRIDIVEVRNESRRIV